MIDRHVQIRSVGIALGKTAFHLVVLGNNGKLLLKKKFTQKQLITFTANMQTSLIGMDGSMWRCALSLSCSARTRPW
jgi:hypothetical protein